MSCHPTPIAEELERLSTSLSARLTANGMLDVLELQGLAIQLRTLARRTAPLERFHAELVAEAAEEELRQSTGAGDFAGFFNGDVARR